MACPSRPCPSHLPNRITKSEFKNGSGRMDKHAENRWQLFDDGISSAYVRGLHKRCITGCKLDIRKELEERDNTNSVKRTS